MQSAIEQEQDTEIEDVCEKIGGTFEQAFAMLIERRDGQYAASIAPLDAEAGELAQEHAAIEEAASGLEKLLPAKARLAQYEADQLTVAGKIEEAEAKREEQRQAEAAPAAMRERQSEIARRIEAIVEEKRTCARRLFEPWYAECQSVIRAAERGLFVTLLDGLWDACLDFEARTCPQRTVSENPMVRGGHRIGLTADGRSLIWAAAQRWYQGPVRPTRR